MALFTKLLCSVSCRALPKPFCYEDICRTTYKATSLYLRFPGLLNSRWLTMCSVREQSHLTVYETDELWHRFPFHWPKRFSKSFHPLPHLLPLAQCAHGLQWAGRARPRGLLQGRPRLQGRLTPRQPGGRAAWPFSLVWTLGLCLLPNLRSRFLTSGLLQNWWYYWLSRSAVMIRLWTLCDLTLFISVTYSTTWIRGDFSWPVDLTLLS